MPGALILATPTGFEAPFATARRVACALPTLGSAVARLSISTPDVGPSGALSVDASGGLTVDLSRVSFIEPFGIAGIISQVQAAARRGQGLTLRMGDGDVARYCQRMDLVACIRRIGYSVEDPFPGQGRVDRSTDLFECQSIADSGSVERLVNLINQRLDDAGVDPSVTDQLTFVVYEMCDNVLCHAEIDQGFAVAQTFPQKGRFQFAIADGGVGIPTKHPAESDGSSIAAAMRHGASSMSNKRGRGFSYLNDYIGELNGQTIVRSGSGAVSRVRQEVSRTLDGMSHLQGTVVAADVPVS